MSMHRCRFIGLIGLVLPAAIHAAPADLQETSAQPEEVASEEMALLRRALSQAEAEGAKRADEVATLNALLDAGSRMLDPRLEPSERVSAVDDLVGGRDLRVLRLAWVGSQVRSAAVREAVVERVATWDHPEVVALLKARALSRWETPEVRLRAVHAIRDRADDDAAMFLYTLASDKRADSDVRVAALAALEERFPDFMSGRVRPAVGGTAAGVGAAMAGNALAGGVMLNSVGIWGKASAAPEVGALSGALIGGTAAGLYARSEPISSGAGLGYASNVAWGLAAGAHMGHAAVGDGTSPSAQNLRALFRTVGVGVGAVSGYQRIGRGPSVDEVWRVNTAGFLGSQLGRASTKLGLGLSADDLACDQAPDPDGCWVRDGERNARHGRVQSAGIVVGAGLGLATGSLLRTAWQPSGEDAVFAGVVGAQSTVAAAMVPTIIGRDDLTGSFMDLGLFTGLTGGLAVSHFRPFSLQQSAMIGYGAAVGNVLAAGASLLPPKPVSARTRAAAVLPSGLVGAGLGGWAHDHVQPTRGDWTMVGVGTTLSGIHMGSAAYIVNQLGGFSHQAQRDGTVLTGTTLASAGFMAAAARWDPQPSDSLFMGTAAAWGAFYGSLGQVAIDAEMSNVARVATGTAFMDVGLGVGAVILSDATRVTPGDTLWPQLFGVAGATVGSLAVMLGTPQAQPVAVGALSGATVGLGLGAVLAPKVQAVTDQLEIPGVLSLPGDWHFLALPAVQENGEMGAAVGLTVTGL